MFRFKLVPDETRVNFIGMRFMAFLLSALMMAGSAFALTTNGLNFGIDFTGGTLIEVKMPETPNLSIMRSTLSGLGLGGVSLQTFGAPTEILIRLQQQAEGEEGQKEVMAKITDALGEGVEYRRIEFVGPQVGGELIRAGLMAIFYSMAGILLYIWLRFEWQFGVAAVIALIHDTFITVGLFSWTQMEFNLSTVAAVLMIAGYSINDTVVAFDRVRENLRKYKKMELPELFNLSINQTLSRTTLTSFTTLLALIALWQFGGEVIHGFTDALVFGIVVGTYSSIFVATPLLLYLNLQRGGPAETAPEAG